MRRLSILVNDFNNITNIDADDFEIKIFIIEILMIKITIIF